MEKNTKTRKLEEILTKAVDKRNGNRVRQIKSAVKKHYKENLKELKTFLTHENKYLAGIATSVYFELTGNLLPAQIEEYGGLGIEANKTPPYLKTEKCQFWFAKLSGEALLYSGNSGNSLWFSENSGSALMNSRNSRYTLWKSKNTGALWYSKNSGNSLYKSSNSGNALLKSENSEFALEFSENSGNALWKSINSKGTLEKSINSKNALKESQFEDGDFLQKIKQST